ncbi:MAG TPA: HD domain-containing protein [Clostridia bacterium]|nr:HD domain-containing protein [Clostridia bacterium]
MSRCSISRANHLAWKYLSHNRYQHSLRVADMAKKLAKRWGAREEFLVRAALLHDLGYSFGGDGLSHAGISGSYSAMVGCDKETVRAIKLHTIGGPAMNLEEKILFLADGIEMGRSFPRVKEIRKLAFINLDKALLAYLKGSKRYLEKQGKSVHRKTLLMENEIRRRKNGRTDQKNRRLFDRKTSQ